MEVTREFLRIFTAIIGGLVLASYVWGISRLPQANDLWGGVSGNLQKFSIVFMFVAALGYMIYWWFALFQIDPVSFSELRWPWGESDGQGGNRLLLSFILFLIPSMLWLESTGLHLRNPTSWTPFLVVGVLLLVAIGNIMLGLLAYSAFQDGTEGAMWMIIGAIAISIQCIINDLIIWSWKFPW